MHSFDFTNEIMCEIPSKNYSQTLNYELYGQQKAA